KKFAATARKRIRLEGGGYRRDHLRALAQRVEVDTGEVRIMGSKSRLLQTLVANNSVNSVPTQGLKWRRGRDSNPRYPCEYAAFRVQCFQPLSHLSGARREAAAHIASDVLRDEGFSALPGRRVHSDLQRLEGSTASPWSPPTKGRRFG